MAKRLQLKDVTIHDIDGRPSGGETNYALLYINALNNTPKGGFDPETMQQRMDLIKKIQDEGMKRNEDGEWEVVATHIDLSKSEYNLLKNCVSDVRWVALSQDIIDYIDHVNNAPDTPKDEEKGE